MGCTRYLWTMRIHARHTTDKVRVERHEDNPRRFKGVLFRFGEISHNRTMVRPGAKVRAAGDAILVDHEYPEIGSFKPYGRILGFVVKDDALLIDFELTAPEAVQLVESGEKKFLSVSWFSDGYVVKEHPAIGAYLEFYDIVIYEVSLVANPAFNTCIATTDDGLACLSPSVPERAESNCCCGEKEKSVSLGDMAFKHQEVTREEFDALREKVQQALDAITALAAEVKALKELVSTPPDEIIQELEQAKKKLDQLEITLSNQANEVVNVLQVAEKLLAITERTYKNLPNLLQR
jgi:FtsZ-binding cell division protein ZapB